MNCEAFLAAHLDGFPDESTEAAADAHLIGCESCWAAVAEDHRGHQLVQSLKEPMPRELADRLLVGLRPRRPRRPTPLVLAALAGAACVLLLVGAWRTQSARSVGSVVTELAMDQQATVTRRDIDGVAVTIASGASSFPMPADARLIDQSTPDVWLIERDGVNVLCVNGARSALLGADVSPERLLELADLIDLI